MAPAASTLTTMSRRAVVIGPEARASGRAICISRSVWWKVVATRKNRTSAPDALFMIPGLGIPLRVLPLLNGAAMVVQQKISPAQIDPAQARMMMVVMPVMMTVLFYQFPSGLVLYWTLSSVLAIAHQLWVGRGLRPTPA